MENRPPKNQLVTARALVQDISKYVHEWAKGTHPVLDYRVVDVFRGLELASRGLTALIEDDHYTELIEFREAFQKAWQDYAITDDDIRENDGSGS